MRENRVRTAAWGYVRTLTCLAALMGWAALSATAHAQTGKRTVADADARDSDDDPPPTTNTGTTFATATRSKSGALGTGTAEVKLSDGNGHWTLGGRGSGVGGGTNSFEAGALGAGTAEMFDHIFAFRDAEASDVFIDTFLVTVHLHSRARTAGRGNATASAFADYGQVNQGAPASGGYSRTASGGESFEEFPTLELVYKVPFNSPDHLVNPLRFKLLVNVSGFGSALGPGNEGAGGMATAGSNLLGLHAPSSLTSSPLDGSLASATPPELAITFHAFDAAGNLVPGVTMTGDSGVSYPVNPAVPEPATTSTALALAAASLVRRRRQSLGNGVGRSRESSARATCSK